MITEDWLKEWQKEAAEIENLGNGAGEDEGPVLEVWAERMTEAAETTRQAAPDQRRQHLLRLYAMASEFAHTELMTKIGSSAYPLAGAWSGSYQADLRLRLQGRAGDDRIMEVMSKSQMPAHNSLDTAAWGAWVTGLCTFLTDRAEVHTLTVDMLSSGTAIYEGTADQILLNCYNIATAIAAAACQWQVAAEAR